MGSWLTIALTAISTSKASAPPPVGCKRVFKIKELADGTPERALFEQPCLREEVRVEQPPCAVHVAPGSFDLFLELVDGALAGGEDGEEERADVAVAQRIGLCTVTSLVPSGKVAST